MNKWIWVVKDYRIPEIDVSKTPVKDTWIYCCKQESLQKNKE